MTPLSNDIIAKLLKAIDIEVIYYLKLYNLVPHSEEEFYEVLKTLDEDRPVSEKILAHTNTLFNSVTDYYKTQTTESVENIVQFVKNGGSNVITRY